ncbi:Crp/Fnr family transcriptional regulator [Alteromonadaceae bacterium BrNp21-10]|nr:Crp/Fnr family transcriptional regulator [Alteromonadaceae bacterium BrNp21-10]
MKIKDLVKQHGSLVSYAKGEHVFRQGDNDEFLYFIQSGFLKAYYLSMDGKEQVKSFLSPNSVIGSLLSCYSKQHCSFSLLCLEQASLVKIPFDLLHNLSQQDITLANELQHYLLMLAMKKEKREYELLCLPAEQRYRQLQAEMPELFNQVTQKDIAHYLGITNVALSRIKKRLHANIP